MDNKIPILSNNLIQLLLSRKGEWIACLVLLLATIPLWREGHITFSDLAFGKEAHQYLNYIIGIFNENLGTPNWFNLPRLLWIIIPYFISQLADDSGQVLMVSLIYSIFVVSGFSFGSLLRRFARYCKMPISEWTIFAGILIYTLNPWVLLRIQHIFLLCGYSIVPLAFSWTWKLLGEESWGLQNFKIKPTLPEIQRHLALGLAVSVSFAGVHFGIFIILSMIVLTLFLSSYSFVIALRQRRVWRWFWWYILRGIMMGGAFLLYSLYWVLPFIFSILQGIRPGQNNINAIETVVLLSRASAVQNVLAGISYWWPMFDHAKLPIFFWIGAYAILGFALIGVWSSKRFILFGFTLFGLTLTTGTHFNYLAPYYISLVFDSSYPFGDMLRDPNKLYGVCILPIALFFSLGAQSIWKYCSQHFILKPSVICLTIVSIFFWILPIYHIFMMGYYQPVIWPPEYEELQTELKKLPDRSKVLYLPVGDLVVDKKTGFGSPDFNQALIQGITVPKATGDHLAFDSRIDTFFPHEGNDVNIIRFIWFLHNILDENNIGQFGSLVAKAGITHVVIRKDYSSFSERFQNYENQLLQQEDLELIWNNEAIHLFKIKTTPDVDFLNQLTYTTGGFERILWLSRILNQKIQHLNFIFAYDGHYTSISKLQKNDLIETDSKENLILSTLTEERFVFPADNLRSANPHLRWSKVLISGYDWEHYSRHYQVANRQHTFDMGHGIAFTVSPLEAPHEAFIAPEDGNRHLERELLQPWTFFHTFEDSQIKGEPEDSTSPSQNSMRISVPSTADPHIWHMLESDFFFMQENMLYHLISTLPRSNDFKLNIRIGFYSEDGNRLGTETAEPIVLLPEPIEKKTKKSFLSPLGTKFGKLEIQVQNPEQKDISFLIKKLALFSLENISPPNTLFLQLPDQDFSEKGLLWLRIFCSEQGGFIEVQEKNLINTIDTMCTPTSKFVWKSIPTAENFSSDIKIINQIGVNAINAVTWTSLSEWQNLETTISQQIEDNIVSHLVDSTELTATLGVEDLQVTKSLMGGTFIKGLNSSLKTSLSIIKSGSYSLIIPDSIPFPDDSYEVFIHQKNKEGNQLILQQEINIASPQRIQSESSLDKGRVIFRNLPLDQGEYLFEFKLKSKQQNLFEWDSLAFLSTQDPTLQKYTTISEEEKSISYQIPITERNWGSIQTHTIPINPETPILLSFQYKVFNIRDLHGKLHYLDENEQIIKSVYLSNTTQGTKQYKEYKFADLPPKEARKLRFQILARHKVLPSPEGRFSIANLQLWESSKAIGIDGFILIEDHFENAESAQSPIISKFQTSRGERSFQIDFKDDSKPKRIQFFESPIHHWIFTVNDQVEKPFALNAISFGLNFPEEETFTIKASIYLNRIWQKGLLVCFLTILILCFMTINTYAKIIKVKEKSPC